MRNSPTAVSVDPTGVRLIYRVAGIAGVICSALFIIAVGVVLSRGLQAGVAIEGLGRLGSNWLVTLFKLHYGVDGIGNGLLLGVTLPDMMILALTAIVGVGLWFVLKATSMGWSLVGMALPVLGIIIYVMTQLSGRSAVMAAVLAFSLIALWSNRLGRIAPIIGILGAALLLLGDFTEPLHSKTIAVLIAGGYVLLALWFMLTGIRLARME